MKFFLSAAALTLLLASLSTTGCAKAKASRLATIRANAIAVVPAPAPVVETPAPAPMVAQTPPAPVKRVRNPKLPSWQQLEPDMTKEEVEEFLGRPNAKSETKWVYKSGASVRFTDKGLLASFDAPRK